MSEVPDTPRPLPWLKATWRCFRLLLALANAGMLLRVVALLILGCGLCSIALSPAKVGQGFRALAASSSLTIALIMSMMTILGSVAISSDRASGALRAVLLRPVPRSALLAAHALFLMALALLLHCGTLGAMAALAHRLHGFGAVTYRGDTILSALEMSEYAWKLIAATLPATLCSALLGLCISTLIEGVVLSVVLGLVLVLGPLLFERLASPLPSWVFTHAAVNPPQVLEQLSRGITLEAKRVDSVHYLLDATTPSLIWSVALLGIALIAMTRRELAS